MPINNLKKTFLLTILIFVLSVFGWEAYIRSTGFEKGFDDGGPLWSHHRARIYAPKNEATVFIGSSRIKFDLDIHTWESLTGQQAVQLACVGSSPRPVLDHLAQDEGFKGRLVIDVTEGLFFSVNERNVSRPNEAIEYYSDITPSQRASFLINKPLESGFVFLDKEKFSLNALLDKLEIPSRPGVSNPPVFARDFGLTKFNRQDFLAREFMADTNQWNQQRAVWAGFAKANRFPPITGKPLDSILLSVKNSVDKIKQRGGEVVFIRTPSSGPFLMGEAKNFPREKYWDRLLAETNCKGIHFLDFPAISKYQCPEFSHLSPEDAIDFTKHFVSLLESEAEWEF